MHLQSNTITSLFALEQRSGKLDYKQSSFAAVAIRIVGSVVRTQNFHFRVEIQKDNKPVNVREGANSSCD